MAASTSIEISHKVVDGFHVFEAQAMPGFYIAHRDLLKALNAIGPAIEKLIELDEGVPCKAVPEVSAAQFLSDTRAGLTAVSTHQRFNLYRQAA